MMQFYTIGVFGSSEEYFFDKLRQNSIDMFCDIRQRRGVRGAQYSFVNSNRLQARLNELGIQYMYISDLAPTTEIREIQKCIDHQKGELVKERQALDGVFVAAYCRQILDKFDFTAFLENLKESRAKRIAFFCVEEYAEACHRSIVTNRLDEMFNFKITHL